MQICRKQIKQAPSAGNMKITVFVVKMTEFGQKNADPGTLYLILLRAADSGNTDVKFALF